MDPINVKALYSGELSVRGVGRVGSLAAARTAHRCRAHRYWAIEEFEKPHPGLGYVERTDLGKFKSKKAANQFLLDVANINGDWRSTEDINAYVSIKIHPSINFV